MGSLEFDILQLGMRLEALEARVAEWGALVEEHEAYFAPLKARVLEARVAQLEGCPHYEDTSDGHLYHDLAKVQEAARPAPQAHEHAWSLWQVTPDTDTYRCGCGTCRQQQHGEPAPQAAAAELGKCCHDCDLVATCNDKQADECLGPRPDDFFYKLWQPRQGGRP